MLLLSHPCVSGPSWLLLSVCWTCVGGEGGGPVPPLFPAPPSEVSCPCACMLSVSLLCLSVLSGVCARLVIVVSVCLLKCKLLPVPFIPWEFHKRAIKERAAHSQCEVLIELTRYEQRVDTDGDEGIHLPQNTNNGRDDAYFKQGETSQFLF